MKKSIVDEKALWFGDHPVKFIQRTISEKKEIAFALQLIRSETSTKAYGHEAIQDDSKRLLVARKNRALKEAWETQYCRWLLKKTEFLPEAYFNNLIPSGAENNTMLTPIVKTSR